MEPNHANTVHFVRVVGELWAAYVKCHSLAECEELSRRVERNQAIRQRLFGQPRVVITPEEGPGDGGHG